MRSVAESHKNKHGTECALERRHEKSTKAEQNKLFYPLKNIILYFKIDNNANKENFV